MKKLNVLFVCTGNSVRSQMAEALLRNFGGDKFNVFSAGTNPAGVHINTIKVMNEIGISMDGHRSKHLEEFKDKDLDYVIPLCEVAALSCTIFQGNGKILNWFIDDPIRVLGGEERRLMAFRITRNILKKKVLDFIKEQFPE